MRAAVAFVAMGVLVVVIGVTTNPVVLVASALALFGAVLLLGPGPTDTRPPSRAGAAVGGGDSTGAATDGRPNGGGR